MSAAFARLPRGEVADALVEARALGTMFRAPRLAEGLLSAADIVAVTRAERDWRRMAGTAQGDPEELAAFRVRALLEALGPEPSAPFTLDDAREAEARLGAEDARRKRLAALPRGFSCGELLGMDFPPPNWIVPELLVSGLTILAGAPKLGKSWLSLALGAAVGSGGAVLGRYRVKQRSALYLALEDTPRRLKERLSKIEASRDARLDIFTTWRSGAEGVADLDAYLEERPDVKLVIIDTLARFRGAPAPGADRYSEDYAVAGAIKALADRHDVAVLVVHHTRKQVAEDVMDSVSGTNGLNGAADATWILSRARGEADAKLFITGRDVEEQEIALTFDRDLCTWRALGDAAEYAMSKERREILDLLRGRKLKPKAIAEALGKNPSTTRVILSKMLREGTLADDADGFYSVPGGVSPINTINSVNAERPESGLPFTPPTAFTAPTSSEELPAAIAEPVQKTWPKKRHKSGSIEGATWLDLGAVLELEGARV